MSALSELMNNGANIMVAVKLDDLRAFALAIIGEARQERDDELLRRSHEVYYSADETSKILGVSKATLWQWNKSDYLCTVKVGRHIKYKKSDVDALLKK